MRSRFARLVDSIRNPRIDRWLAVALLLVIAVARAASFEERDPYWEARAGVENLAGEPLLRPDTWSWAPVSGDWYQNSPLWNDILGLGWLAGGFWGLFVVSLALIAGYLLLSLALARRLGGRALPAAVGIIAMVSPAISMVSPRGTLVVQVIVLGSVAAAVWFAAGPARRISTWLAVTLVFGVAAAVSILGNWLHLSFLLFGPAMAVICLPVWWLAPLSRSRRIAIAGGNGVGWVIGPVFSPYGLVDGLQHSREVAEICDGLIVEWVSPFAQYSTAVFWFMAFVAVLAAVLVTAWLILRIRRGDRSLELGALLALSMLGVPAALAGLTAIRFLGVALLTLAPVVGVAVGDGLDALRRRVKATPDKARRTALTERLSGNYWRPILAFATVVIIPWSLAVGSTHAVPAETKFVVQLPQDCRLFAPAGLAATWILGRPDVTVWIDGRADFYGRSHLLATYAYFGLTAPTLVPDGATCLLTDKELRDSRDLAAALVDAPQWRIAAEDDRFALWVPAS